MRETMLKLNKLEENLIIEDWQPKWGNAVLTSVGSLLIQMAMKVCLLPVVTATDVKGVFKEIVVPAFQHGIISQKVIKKIGIIKVHPQMQNLIANSACNVSPWALPMVVKPLPWLSTTSGGYILHRFKLVRTRDNDEHDNLLTVANEHRHLDSVMRALDVLGTTGWRINEGTLKVAVHFWNSNESFSGMPSGLSSKQPIIKPVDYDTNKQAKKEYTEAISKQNIQARNDFSERSSINYKLDIAYAVISFD